MMRHDDFIHSFNILSYDLIATNLELTTTKPEIKKRKKERKADVRFSRVSHFIPSSFSSDVLSLHFSSCWQDGLC